MSPTRRTVLTLPTAMWIGSTMTSAQQPDATSRSTVPATFPSHDPALAREMVAVSHGNVARVRELLNAHPALAKATWDWGYGDWETALGAASHVGNREIAELLLANGAAPTLFSAAMLGQTEVVKAMVAAAPGIQRTKGPHGISLLAHAKVGGPRAADVLAYLTTLGDADPHYINEPLTDADQKAVVGTFTFGNGPADVFTIAAGTRGLTITRQGAAERNLFHLGSRIFHPPGAETVRITLGAGDRAATLTIADGPIVVTAVRT
jgi:hypothetical protein